MNHDEIDAAPEMNLCAVPKMNLWTEIIETRYGVFVRVPVWTGSVLWNNTEEPLVVVDRHGCYWRVGWHKGVRYKQRTSQL